ncbi:hypothetical protein FACS1894151_05050 [Spirochaetia bacterium]|nr:hypothetical protein FACS1894151_05050 [Spirochaetia bacterium]
MRHFNITGLCIAGKHYMVDISGRVAQVKTMVDRGQYFTINRARQYGKTTLLWELEKTLAPEYICVSTSFEGIGDEPFATPEAFCQTFMELVQRKLRFTPVKNDQAYIDQWVDPAVVDFKLLSRHITKMCRDKKIILMIDEVDKTSNNRTYIHFLGMLRDKYLDREKGADFTFQSVILAGVYDIRNIKLKLINEGMYSPAAQEGKLLNSPWNIAVKFDVDMSFHPEDIAGMLADYENDYHTGMDIKALSELIYEYTGGYPYLVSDICQIIDEKMIGEKLIDEKLIDEKLDKNWTTDGVMKAVKIVLNENSTLLDDLTKNMEMYQDLYNYIYELMIPGNEKKFNIRDGTLNWGLMFGFLKQNGESVVIANRIFESVLMEYFLAKDSHKRNQKRVNGVLKQDVIKADGSFDMELCLRKFAAHYREIFNKNDEPFLERNGRLVFLAYLSPLLNGRGFYHIESQFTDLRRMDIVVDFGKEQHVIELKLWKGEAAREAAYSQLAGYLNSKSLRQGYLITFDFRKNVNKRPCEQWVDWEAVRILDIVL